MTDSITSSAAESAPEPVVDVVIAVHNTARPIARAIGSVLAGADGQARITVVCHGVSARAIRAKWQEVQGNLVDSANRLVRFVELDDGIRSPAGPFNHGLDLATATYVAVMGSDDTLGPGAVAAWIAAARERDSAILLAPLRLSDRRLLNNPLVRFGTGRRGPFRLRKLDPVRDRVAYRSAPLGLMRRDVLERLGLRFTPGLTSGEDLAVSVRLWFSGERIDYVRGLPAYCIGGDAVDRVTSSSMTLSQELAAVEHLRDQKWLASLNDQERRSLTIKILRIHILGAVERRANPASWGPGEVEILRDVAMSWLTFSAEAGGSFDNALAPFACADRAVLEAVLTGNLAAVLAADTNRRTAGRITTIFPRSARALWDREGTLRRYIRYRIRW